MTLEAKSCEEADPSVEEFKMKIRKGDGSLIPLEKTAPNGEQLFLTTRYLPVPLGGERETVDVAWTDISFNPARALLLVNVYMETENGLFPIAHMDWAEREDYADGGDAWHECVTPNNEYERLAQERWPVGSNAIDVDPGYQENGLGTLMVATSWFNSGITWI